MKKTDVANMTIGLFFSPDRLEQRTMLAEALTKEGAKITTIGNMSELDRVLRDTNPALRPEAIIFDSTQFDLKTTDALAEAEIAPIAVDFSLPKGARVQAGESRVLGNFIQQVFTKETQPA